MISSTTIADKEVLSFLSPKTQKEVFYQSRGCWYNAPYNQKNAYADLDLKVKVGSNIYIKDEKVAGWGYVQIKNRICHPQGMKDWKDILQNSNCDIHCWLEDKNGNIYDWDLMNKKPIEGESPSKLKKKGITYKAVSGDVEKLLYITANIKLKLETMYIYSLQKKDFKDAVLQLSEAPSMTSGMLKIVLEHHIGDEFFSMDALTQNKKLIELFTSFDIEKEKYDFLLNKPTPIVIEMKTKTEEE